MRDSIWGSEAIVKGTDGAILTVTNARGEELENAAERRREAIPGRDLVTSLDLNIQMYAEQLAYRVMRRKMRGRSRFL